MNSKKREEKEEIEQWKMLGHGVLADGILLRCGD
jgi:hypothetical protein